jgi:hypothetical protein
MEQDQGDQRSAREDEEAPVTSSEQNELILPFAGDGLERLRDTHC